MYQNLPVDLIGIKIVDALLGDICWYAVCFVCLGVYLLEFLNANYDMPRENLCLEIHIPRPVFSQNFPYRRGVQ